MACGDKYSHLLRASGGRTVDEPFSNWCNEVDAEAWYGQATHVHKLQVEAWNALMKIENEKGEWPHIDKLKPAAEAYDAAYKSLPEPSAWMAFGMAGCAEAVEEMIGNIRQGACVLEQLNDGISSYGVAPVDPGAAGGFGGTSAVWWVVGGVAVLGAVGGLAYYLTTRRASSSPSTTVVLANGRNGNGRRNGNGNGARR